MKKKVKWGILGCAGIAEKQFLPALKDCAESDLWAIGSRNKNKAQTWAQEWGAQKAYGSYEEVLADPQVEAVYIPLPNHLHAEWTIKALQAKKHVLCEKPMGVNVAECEEMLRVADEEQRVFMEGFMYRFHPQIDQALTWIKAGAIGQVRLVKGSFSFLLTDPKNVRLLAAPGGGSSWDVGCYPIHLSNLIFGGPPVEVMAQVQLDAAGVDLAMIGLLKYGEDQRGIFDCSFVTDEGSSFEIIGEKGTIIIPEPWRPDRQKVSIALISGNERKEITFPINNPYQLEIEHFQTCLKGKTELLLPGFLGRDVVATIEALHHSARQGLTTQVAKAN